MLQRITAISIIAILLFNAVSRYPAFKFEQWQIHIAISARIETIFHENELQLVTVANNSPAIEWLRAGKEFRYNGRLYDVVRSEQTDSVTTYYCISDDDETRLVGEYESFIQAQQNENSLASNKSSITLLKIFFSLIYLPKQEVAAYLPFDLRLQHSNVYRCFYSGAFTGIAAPPPKSFV